MRELGDLSSDAVRSDELSTGEVGTVAVPRRSNDDQLPRPSLLHFAVGVAIALIALALMMYAVHHLVNAASIGFDDSIFVGISWVLLFYLLPMFWLQLFALFHRSKGGAFFSAIIQGCPGLCFFFVFVSFLIKVFQFGFEAIHPGDFVSLAVLSLLLLGSVLNLRWHHRLSDNDVRPTWIRRYQLSELAAMTAGFCIAAAIIAPFFSR